MKLKYSGQTPQKTPTAFVTNSNMRERDSHRLLIALMMEAARTSETLVNFYQNTWCYKPKDSHSHTHRRENLKSYLDRIVYNVLA
jgi:hypothetical protein